MKQPRILFQVSPTIINQIIFDVNVIVVVNAASIQENLLRLIQGLGEYLTNDDEFVRAKGKSQIIGVRSIS